MVDAKKSTEDIILARVQEQIDWYNRKSRKHHKIYKQNKYYQLIFASLIPFLSSSGSYLHQIYPAFNADNIGFFVGMLGVLIVISKGHESVNQSHSNWLSFRATCESLKHEQFLYLAKAGQYAGAKNPQAKLAERTEAIVSTETSHWVSGQQSDQTNREELPKEPVILQEDRLEISQRLCLAP